MFKVEKGLAFQFKGVEEITDSAVEILLLMENKRWKSQTKFLSILFTTRPSRSRSTLFIHKTEKRRKSTEMNLTITSRPVVYQGNRIQKDDDNNVNVLTCPTWPYPCVCVGICLYVVRITSIMKYVWGISSRVVLLLLRFIYFISNVLSRRYATFAHWLPIRSKYCTLFLTITVRKMSNFR